MAETLGVAEAKKRFSELIDRVGRGERFLIVRRGKAAMVLVSPDQATRSGSEQKPVGLAAVAGALSDWEEINEVVDEIYASRRRARDRVAPDLG